MKTRLFTAAVTAFLFTLSGYAQTKHALVFAIGDYPTTGGWKKISSARDVNYIKSTLIKQDFKADNITVIKDAQATREGIDKAFRALIPKINPKDVVVIHFSSHGVQLADDNADEADGYDETIVPYDAILPSSDLEEAEYNKVQVKYFRDDALGAYVDEIRARAGKEGDVLVFMDACHSGTGTRGHATGIARGLSKPVQPRGYNGVINMQSASSMKDTFTETPKSTVNKNNLATYVVFSAAQAHELNYETFNEKHEGMGSLTYAISKVFEKLEKGASYRSVFAKVQAIMNERVPGQSPVIEGTGLERGLFAGNYVNQKPYITIEALMPANKITLNGGRLAGLETGALVAVYPSGTLDPANTQPLATGKVIESASYSSIVQLNKAAGLKVAASGWVFVTDPVYNVAPISVAIKPASRGAVASFNQAEITSLSKALKSSPAFKLTTGNSDLIITKGPSTDSIFIAADGQLFTTLKNAATDTAKLIEEIDRYARYKFLKELTVEDSTLKVEVAFVPFIKGKPDTSAIATKIQEGKYRFYDGDKAFLLVKNKGEDDIFINILDMQPDGIINPILPHRDQKMMASEMRIPAGTSRLFSNYELTMAAPYGVEVYKIFISKSVIDLEDLATKKDTRARGSLGVLEGLVKTSGESTRGTQTNNLKGANGKTYNLVFDILPNN